MTDEARAAWVGCSLAAARQGRLPSVSVASGQPATTSYEAWVKVGVGASMGAAAAGRIGLSSAYVKVQIPMTDEEARRVPRRVGQIASLLVVIYWFVVGFGGMAFGVGLTATTASDRAGLVPGAVIFFGGIALFAASFRWRFDRNKWVRTRFDHRTDELKLWTCPAFADAVAAAKAAAAHPTSTVS